MDMRERYLGAMVGMAAGDAVGTTLEFRRPGSFRPITDMLGGGPFGLRAGEWTDDTAMALCLAASLVERGGFDPRDQMDRYGRWVREGYMSSNGRCFDVGGTVMTALCEYSMSDDPYAGSTSPSTAGNGSLMRLAPIPLAYAADPRGAITKAALMSRTTHGAPQAVDGCRYYAGLILGALQGVAKAELVAPGYSPVPGLWEAEPLDARIAEVLHADWSALGPPAIAGTGYVVKSLEAALWAFATTDDFRSGCLRAANLGDDADTTAAVYGQLAGAYYGIDGIPAAWRQQLAHGPLIESLAENLLTLSGKNNLQ